MKKTLMCVALVWAAGNAFAQTQAQKPRIEKGTGVVSLDMHFWPVLYSSRSSGPASQKAHEQAVSIKPTVSGGYFVANNFMVGAGFGVLQGWYRHKTGSDPTYKDASNTFVVPSLIFRYYRMFTPKVGFYAQLSGEAQLQVSGDSETQMSLGALLSPRIVFFPKPGWGINAGFGEIGYRYNEFSPGGNTNSKYMTHELVADPILSIGASYFIGKKKV